MVKVLQGEGGTVEDAAPADRRADQLPRRPRRRLRRGAHQPHAGARQPRRAGHRAAGDRAGAAGADDRPGPRPQVHRRARSTAVSQLVGATSDLLREARVPAARTIETLPAPWPHMLRRPRASSSTRRCRSFGEHRSRASAGSTSYENAVNVYLCSIGLHGRRARHQPGRRQRALVGGVPMKPLVHRDPFRIGLVAIAFGVVVGLVILVLSVVSLRHHAATPPCSSTPPACARARTCRSTASRSAEVTGIELDGQARASSRSSSTRTSSSARRRRPRSRSRPCSAPTTCEVDPQGSGELADDRIPLERTAVPYNLQDVIEGGTKNARGARRRHAGQGADRGQRDPVRVGRRHRPGAAGRRPALRGGDHPLQPGRRRCSRRPAA